MTIMRAAEECDAVVVSGGSSKDRHDITAETIGALGEIYVHGISIAPGKPTIIGKIDDIPVIGLPGHPASTFHGSLPCSHSSSSGDEGIAMPENI